MPDWVRLLAYLNESPYHVPNIPDGRHIQNAADEVANNNVFLAGVAVAIEKGNRRQVASDAEKYSTGEALYEFL